MKKLVCSLAAILMLTACGQRIDVPPAHSALLPSYMPKGTQQRLPPVAQPVPQETPAPIVDLAPKPVPLEQRKQEQLEAYKRGLPFATPANTSSAPTAK